MKDKVVIVTILVIILNLFLATIVYNSSKESFNYCQKMGCNSPSVYIQSLQIGSLMVLLSIFAVIIRNKLSEFLNTRKNLKVVLSIILVFVISTLYLIITNPCKDRPLCDYTVGFPIMFLLVTDYLDFSMLIWFITGITSNFLIWYFLLSIIFYKFGKPRC